MHIGLNLIYLVPGATGGMEVYARELIPELVRAAPQVRFTAFVSHEGAAGDGPWNELIESVRVPVRAQSRAARVRAEQQLLPRLAQRAGVDLLHSLASTAPAWGHFRRVVTIHDLIYRQVPAAHPGLRALGMRLLIPLAARRSDRIIADTVSARDDLRRFLHVPDARIDVVPLGTCAPPRLQATSPDVLRRRLDAGDRRVALSVSAKLAHKNLMRLIESLGVLAPELRPLLVLPGYPTAHERELKARAEQLGLAGDVRFLGWISAGDLEGLYRLAEAFVFPSLAEGFGLPVLEAMQRGVPVACADRGAVAEVAGPAALGFDPESTEQIASALQRLLQEPGLAARLIAAGYERAAQFSWSQTAVGTLASYDRALAASS